jgi:hypothetical protein
LSANALHQPLFDGIYCGDVIADHLADRNSRPVRNHCGHGIWIDIYRDQRQRLLHRAQVSQSTAQFITPVAQRVTGSVCRT